MMPFKIAINSEIGLIDLVFWGQLNMDELGSFRKEMTSHPDFNPGFRVLADIRKIEGVDIPNTNLEGFAREGPLLGNAVTAIVVATNFAFGMARRYMLQQGRDNPEINKIFWDIDEARLWIEQGLR